MRQFVVSDCRILVRIPTWEVSEASDHVLFNVDIALVDDVGSQQASWRVQRRFREFVDLHEALSKLGPMP
jgi:hypothetical protein